MAHVPASRNAQPAGPVQRVRQHRADRELRRGPAVAYRFLLAESRRRGDTKALTELSSLGSPPYTGPEGIAKWRRCARWLGEFGAL